MPVRVPSYDSGLGTVLPAVLHSLGVPGWPVPTGSPPVLPEARQAVVVLADGLGSRLLDRRAGHAPYLRRLQRLVPELDAPFPSTTAVSLATLGTGLPPGQHGLTGWRALVPGSQQQPDRLLNHLAWDPRRGTDPDPLVWQPHPTLLQQAQAHGVAVTSVSRGEFAGSGLTSAALRGGSFRAAATPQERVEATLAALHEAGGGPALVYLYWGEVDKAGHVHGPDSWQWGEALELLDATLAQLARRLPSGAALTITADHGMVAAPEQQRRDLAHEPELAGGVRLLGGEPRAPQAWCEPGQADEVRERWSRLLGEDAIVRSRSEALADGWFGPQPHPDVLPRIGEVVVAMTGSATVLDSRDLRPQVLALRGHHGSLTDDELCVPLLHHPAAGRP